MDVSQRPDDARAFWVEDRSLGSIRTVDLPPPGTDEVVVETLFSGISRGTETLVFQHRVPPSQYAVMRCPFQEGQFPAPVKYGYSAVGRVVRGPEDLLDRVVFVLHPHQTRFVVPASAALPIPPNVPPGRAVLAANMETALNGLWDAEAMAGDNVCVVGAGVIGLLTGWLAASVAGVSVMLIDTDPAKAATAGALGLPFQSVGDKLEDFDVVLHVSGNPEGLRTALALAGFEARIVEMSWFGDREVSLPLGENFHSRRLSIRSSQVGAVAASRRARWTHRRRLELALRLLADDRLDALISGESPFESLPEVMRDLARGTLPALCHRIRY
jgi:2-desacetyl-2-hydroxyethyl bacteriochlorophyllide A dehydrogenase